MAAMQGLFVETYRCPDGVELVPDTRSQPQPHSPFFHSRTTRRELLRLEIEDLKNPVVVEFVNAREDADRIKFFSKFGALSYDAPIPPSMVGRVTRDESGPTYGSHHDDVIHFQEELRDWLTKVTGPSQVDALEAINSSWSRGKLLQLTPAFDLAGEGGAPRMLLECPHLAQFMSMELAMIAMHGAKLGTCEHCGAIFLTGPLTGRRSHAKYCSDRCRVAAMRARNAAKSAT